MYVCVCVCVCVCVYVNVCVSHLLVCQSPALLIPCSKQRGQCAVRTHTGVTSGQTRTDDIDLRSTTSAHKATHRDILAYKAAKPAVQSRHARWP